MFFDVTQQLYASPHLSLQAQAAAPTGNCGRIGASASQAVGTLMPKKE